MEQSNIDAAMRLAKQDADKTVRLVAALMFSCHDNLQNAVLFFVPLSRSRGEDLDENPLEKLTFEANMIDQKEQLYRKQASMVPIVLPKLDPEDLTFERAGYRASERVRNLSRAESDLANARKRVKKQPVSLDPKASQMIETLRGYLTDFRQGSHATATVVGPNPSPEWKERLKAMDQDSTDLNREIRLLEIYLTLERISDLTFDQSKK